MGLKLAKKEVSDPYKEMEDQAKKFKRKDAADNKRFNNEVKEVMEGLNVSKAEAEAIVENKNLRMIREALEPSKKEIRKYMKQQGEEVNKGGLLKKKKAKRMMGGGKVYSRGSRKANYNV
tara:strand:+ start:3815 stop:4174 length:360 start_codon:yes stop_codon:yes gene_type:complete